MKISAQMGFGFAGSNTDYYEIRRKILKGEPIGAYDSYRLVIIPEDVFIMHAADDNFVQTPMEPSPISSVNITEKLANSKGNLGYLWNKVSKKCPNAKSATKAFLTYLGMDQLFDITSTIKDKTGEISHTINDKIGSAFDKLNDKIKDFSLNKLDDLAGEIADKNHDIRTEAHDTTHTDNAVDKFSDEVHGELHSSEDSNTPDEQQNHDDTTGEDGTDDAFTDDFGDDV